MTLSEIIAQGVWAALDVEMAQKRSFEQNRRQVELRRWELVRDWTLEKRVKDWPSLLESLRDEYEAYGFVAGFYAHKFHENPENLNNEVWEKFMEDWRELISLKVEQILETAERESVIKLESKLQRYLKEIPPYLEVVSIDHDEFAQVWSTMNGFWNTVDFERMRQVVQIQRKYPILVEIAQKMGRVADENSRQRMSVASGNSQQLQHATKADIQGITIGDDLNAMLPLEMAESADESLEDLFFYKYVTKSLQNFQHQSHLLKPVHQLQMKAAKQRGPMIVCLDTSGSMYGQPELIGHSMLVKLLHLADTQDRDLYLIAFSVSIHPIELRKERGRLHAIFQKTSTGDTDASKMVTEVCRLLHDVPAYMSSDVLWITDFKMKLVEQDLLDQMQKHRRNGTCFYGLRTGLADEPVWEPYFERIYDVAIPHFRKYGK